MFNQHVIEYSFDNISQLHYDKYDLGMHSPLVFKFHINKSKDILIQNIINKHHLKKGKTIPGIVKNSKFISHSMDINLYELMKNHPFYLILYKTKHDSIAERILIINGNEIVFHTTGYVDPDNIINYGYEDDQEGNIITEPLSTR
jgi:hypothetical protein